MNIFEYKLNDEVYIPSSISNDFSNKNICFFDIETTGLSSRYNEIILIGVLCLEGESIYIKQFFADDPCEENEILAQFAKLLNRFEHIISFNGKSFDVPFLRNRFNHHNIFSNIDEISHQDLLQLVRKNKDLLCLENCKLKTVEKYLGIYREDTISGKDSVDLYKSYVYSKDKIKRDIILKHNYDDIFYLHKLLSLYDIIEKKSMLTINLDFQNIDFRLNINKTSILFEKSFISILGNSQFLNIPPQVHYKEFYSLNWSTSNGIFELQLFHKTASLSDGSKCSYLDLSNHNLTLSQFNNINYNIPNHLVLLKINNTILYDNISILIKEIISQLD